MNKVERLLLQKAVYGIGQIACNLAHPEPVGCG